MNIPKANIKATPHNREQSERIAKARGYTTFTWQDDGRLRGFGATVGKEGAEDVFLPNGSFTLDQVVGMLEAENADWVQGDSDDVPRSGWELPDGEWLAKINQSPFDLTAAMDALIKVLEKKK